ncbi:hypothetical protein RF11_14208 [Thelohanellus kitauei]|uniref:Alpha-soluble NSF attachment protein n=1 Tax=Thelohanellus kitauei TaxID=669202 RepID=A0A0C2JAY8_THEKT|nr:hypothetical protein RF11_14208 [Thelohanellus kitauei]
MRYLTGIYAHFCKFVISQDLVVDKYYAYLKKAKLYNGSGRLEDACNSYNKAAKLAKSKLIDFSRASLNYFDAAICLFNISPDRAYVYFKKCINAFVDSEDIASAIFYATRCGYLYETKCCNLPISIKLYQKADKLRHRNNIVHKCIIIDDDLIDIEQKNPLAQCKFDKIINKSKILGLREHQPLGTSISQSTDLCVKCITAYAKLDDDFDRYIYTFKRRNSFGDARNIIRNCVGSSNPENYTTLQSCPDVYRVIEPNVCN